MSHPFTNYRGLGGLLRLPQSRIFVSYHHRADRWYYEEFSRVFHDRLEVIEDCSVEREIDSEDPEYVHRAIRENCISGTSCTIVLCGAQTFGRKHVDWEIKTTLDKEHGLIAVRLPTNVGDGAGKWYVPDRLLDNIENGYALTTTWTEIHSTPALLTIKIAEARAREKRLIKNDRPMRGRNA